MTTLNHLKTATLKAILILICINTAMLLLHTLGLSTALTNTTATQTAIHLLILTSTILIARSTNQKTFTRKNWNKNDKHISTQAC